MEVKTESSQLSWRDYVTSIEEKNREKNYPLRMTFEVTPLCNFKCKMCYVHLDKQEQKCRKNLLDYDQWIELANACFDAGVLEITFTGGEVFTYPEFISLYEAIYDKGFLVNILSNGYLITEEIIKRLQKRKPHKMRVTLYGASNDTYLKVTGIHNGYDIVSNNILALQKAGINIGVSMTVIQDNKKDLEIVKHWVRDNNMEFIHTCRIQLPQRGAQNDAKNIRIVSDDFGLDLVEHVETSANRDLIEKYKRNPFSFCSACNKAAVMTWEGKLQGCLSITNYYEDVFSQDLLSAFRRLWDRLLRIKMPEKCLECKLLDYCMLCPGILAGETGDPETTAPYVCAMARWNYSKIEKTDQIKLMDC